MKWNEMNTDNKHRKGGEARWSLNNSWNSSGEREVSGNGPWSRRFSTRTYYSVVLANFSSSSYCGVLGVEAATAACPSLEMPPQSAVNPPPNTLSTLRRTEARHLLRPSLPPTANEQTRLQVDLSEQQQEHNHVTLPGTAIYYGKTLHHHLQKGIVCKFTRRSPPSEWMQRNGSDCSA